ncbi:lipid-A-disaccharide synthase [Aestuariispira ectoiniformans]|uniref:lipid-A-disaccharide synthase n=1 Tax=Aestuariispira ectoiniformans TaxID=2775080 RepID=UPI00223B66C7|nr:lipid-A-disaccharide synthase [Aestuariispira ectoiniformans]
MSQSLKIFLVAGEASGDALGARLMAALKTLSADITFCGVGGPLMEAEGMKSLFPMHELSVMGLVEILPHVRKLFRRIKQTAKAVEKSAPDAVVTIDSPGFAHQLAGRIQHIDCPKIHYVAPSVWAWKPGRVHKCKKHFDHLLALLPFEPPYFEAVGLPCHFVGHSVLESGADQGNGPAFRAKYGISSEDKILCVLPGSRRGEVSRLLPVFGETVHRVADNTDNLHVVVPTTEGVKELVEETVKDWPVQPIMISGQIEKYDAMAASDVALAASGTVALELAMARLPTVIGYKVSPITYFLAKRLVKTPYAHLLNTILDRFVVPERIQNDCTPELLSTDVLALFGTDGKRQIAELIPALEKLHPNMTETPSQCAARVVLDVIEGQIKK